MGLVIHPPKHAALRQNEYRCAMCGDVYGRVRPDDECLAEERENFGRQLDEDDRVITCHDCYLIFMQAYDGAGRPPVPVRSIPSDEKR